MNTKRNTDKGKLLLDVILTNAKYIRKVGTLSHFISDLQPIYVVKKKARDMRPVAEFSGGSYRNYDRDMFENKLDYDWEEYYRITDPELAWEDLLGRIVRVLDEMCPIR